MPVAASPAASNTAPRHKFTRDEFYRMTDLGFFEGKVELIEGDIREKMPPNPPHAVATDVDRDVLARAFSLVDCCIRVEKPAAVDINNDPQPDVCVARGPLRNYLAAHPTPADILLLVEVSDATLDFDRNVKSPRYALAGIREYWIVNLRDRQVEVFRSPVSGAWTSQFVAPESGVVTPLAAPGSVVPVADLLP